MRPKYDVVVVGGRVAGAATAMLLARAGADVLLVERSPEGRDTLSTHALLRGAVVQLERWGLLSEVIGSTPAITSTTFRYPDGDVDVPIDPLYAPRRTVLDPILVSAARSSGAEVTHETRLVGLEWRADRVCGVRLHRGSREYAVSTDLVVGADGLHSTVATLVGAPIERVGGASNATIMTYVGDADLDPSRYLWAYGPEALTGVIPTNDDLFCVFTSLPTADFRTRRYGVAERAFTHLLERVDPETARVVGAGRRAGPLRSTPGHVGQFRQAAGSGWALVGDAGYFKDPGAAHGISDAFRDAQLLADAVLADDLTGYGPLRNRLSAELFDVLERIVSFDWTMAQLPELHGALIGAMSNELRAFVDMTSPTVEPSAA